MGHTVRFNLMSLWLLISLLIVGVSFASEKQSAEKRADSLNKLARQYINAINKNDEAKYKTLFAPMGTYFKYRPIKRKLRKARMIQIYEGYSRFYIQDFKLFQDIRKKHKNIIFVKCNEIDPETKNSNQIKGLEILVQFSDGFATGEFYIITGAVYREDKLKQWFFVERAREPHTYLKYPTELEAKHK